MAVVRLVLAIVVLFGTGAVLEKMLPLAQDSAYNQFADTRCTLGLPNTEQMSCPTFPYFWRGYTVLRGRSRPVVVLTCCRAA
jgi:hypothetical protein